MADWTGLEPATPGVERKSADQGKCVDAGGPRIIKEKVGDDGIEPPTLCL